MLPPLIIIVVMSETHITISPRLKRIKGAPGHYRPDGYNVEAWSTSPEKGESRVVEFHKQHHDAEHQAIWWSHHGGDAEITEYGTEWNQVIRKYRPSELPADHPILRKVLADIPPQRG